MNMSNAIKSWFSAFAITCVASSAAAMPSEIVCQYPAFVGSDTVLQRLVLQRGQYVDQGAGLGMVFDVVGQQTVALHLVNAAGGAITSIAIETDTGDMLKVSSATFGSVNYRRGRCLFY
jgi:hypothetical protein